VETSEQIKSTINLEGVERIFQILGIESGMLALSANVAEHYMKADPKVVAFIREMKSKYGKPRLEGSPASEQNMSREDKPGLNYFLPQRMLTDTCLHRSLVRTDRKKYTDEWFEKCIAELMKSEYRDKIASQWAQKDQKKMIKGWVLGALLKAKVFKGTALSMARQYYDTTENTSEVKTLAKYMGELRKCDYANWIDDYVLVH